jgi:hypothetical protein
LNSNGAAKEKRARREATRPEPTIYGNCDSWNFIVGKTRRTYSRDQPQTGSLQSSNKDLIHSLLTKLMGKSWDNLWAICGSAVQRAKTCRIVVFCVFDIPLMQGQQQRFYPKM